MPVLPVSPVAEAAALVAGIACRRGAPAAELIALVELALLEAGYCPADLASIATLESKISEPAVAAAASRFGVPVRGLSATELAAFGPLLPTPSQTVAGYIGLQGVAEAAVLACGDLVLAKRKSAHATCALGHLPGKRQ